MTERGNFKKYSEALQSHSSKAVYNIELPFTYSEFTVHMQNQLKAGSFVGTRAGLLLDMQFFSYVRAMK